MNEQLSAGSKTALRLVPVAVAWLLRIIFQWSDERPPLQPAIPLDAALVALHLWAIRPLQAAMGERFGKRPSWTAQLVAPFLLAVFLLARDLWFAIKRILAL